MSGDPELEIHATYPGDGLESQHAVVDHVLHVVGRELDREWWGGGGREGRRDKRAGYGDGRGKMGDGRGGWAVGWVGECPPCTPGTADWTLLLLFQKRQSVCVNIR